ncbi:hypothetical protein MBLNU13_g03425t1 [Cladosporium sp. NU13]
MATQLPETMRALVVHSTDQPPTVEQLPVPQPFHGSAVVQVLAAGVISYIRDIYNGKRNYPFPTPLVAGTSAIARVVAVGPDAVKLKPGDLVFVDCTVRARDSDDIFLAAISQGFGEGSARLMRDVWRDWVSFVLYAMGAEAHAITYAEYCRAPLESLTILDEKRLVDDFGYSLGQLMYAATLLVPYGGLRDINLQAGETVICAPATGPFGGAAVVVALAMGAKVIAMGRNKDSLAKIEQRVAQPGRLKTVPITNDMEADLASIMEAAGGEVDAYFDIGPREAVASTHFKSAILALRHAGRVSLMGGYLHDVPSPHFPIVRKNIRLQGKWMYERSDIRDFFKMVNAGLLDLGICEVQGEYGLDYYREAWDEAADTAGFARVTVMKP